MPTQRSRIQTTSQYPTTRVLNLTRLVVGQARYEIVLDGDSEFSTWCLGILTSAGISAYHDRTRRTVNDPKIYELSELLLIDLGQFGDEDMGSLARVRRHFPDMPVVAVFDPAAIAQEGVWSERLPETVAVGIAGMLPRTCSGDELLATVSEVLSRQRELDRRSRAAWQHFTDAVLLLDANGRLVLDANPAAEELSGYERNELLRIDITALLPHAAAGDAEHRAAARELKKHGVMPVASWLAEKEQEVLLRRRDGRLVPVSLSISQIPYDRQLLYLIVARDISKRWQITRQMIQTEKLAALQRLTSCVAHEVNNPLQALHNSLHLLLSRSFEADKQQRYLLMAHAEVDRLISMVQRLLDIHRAEPEAMRPTHLHRVVQGVVTLIEQQLNDNHITVVYDLHPDLPAVSGVPSLLKQVFLNLLLNAMDAMPGQGVVTIRSYVANSPSQQSMSLSMPVPVQQLQLFPDTPDAQPPRSTTDQWVVVEVHDTGSGLEPDELAKIFEPFYTTRSEGHGLGLAICYGIVEKHNGTLTAESILGKGTIFRVALPALHES